MSVDGASWSPLPSSPAEDDSNPLDHQQNVSSTETPSADDQVDSTPAQGNDQSNSTPLQDDDQGNSTPAHVQDDDQAGSTAAKEEDGEHRAVTTTEEPSNPDQTRVAQPKVDGIVRLQD